MRLFAACTLQGWLLAVPPGTPPSTLHVPAAHSRPGAHPTPAAQRHFPAMDLPDGEAIPPRDTVDATKARCGACLCSKQAAASVPSVHKVAWKRRFVKTA